MYSRGGDENWARGKTVIIGRPHTFACPNEAKEHADAVAIGEGEALWPVIMGDFQADRSKGLH